MRPPSHMPDAEMMTAGPSRRFSALLSSTSPTNDVRALWKSGPVHVRNSRASSSYRSRFFLNTSVARVAIGLKISETGLNFNVTGDESLHSPSEYFRKDGRSSTGGIQLINDIVGAHSLPDHVDSTEMQFRWKVVLTDPEPDVVCFAGLSTHTVYTVLSAPKAPMAVPWIEVLEYSCSPAWAEGTSDDVAAATEITEGIYHMGIHYGTWSGYTSGPSNAQIFNLPKFLRDMEAPPLPNVDCHDCAHLVQIFGNAIGLQCSYEEYNKCDTNIVLPIGSTQLVAWTGLEYHQFAVLGGKTYDATIHGDGDGKPAKIPFQETALVNLDFDAYIALVVRNRIPFEKISWGTVRLP